MVLNSITGKLTEKHSFACCEVSGVEWLLAMSEQSLAVLPQVGAQVRIYTQLKVSENSIALYGFATREERSLFEALVSVPGIGPKLALAVLSKAPARDLAALIMQGDAKSLAKLPGLGSKMAQKVILQLGDKLTKLLPSAPHSEAAPNANNALAASTASPSQGNPYQDLLNALLAMGYQESRGRATLDELYSQWQSSPPEEGERLRQAIVRLSR